MHVTKVIEIPVIYIDKFSGVKRKYLASYNSPVNIKEVIYESAIKYIGKNQEIPRLHLSGL